MSSFIKSEYEDYRVLLKEIPSLLLTVLVLSVVSMNLLANKELLRTSWVALDCGFALSWIPFLIMDAICRAYGGKAAAKISILAVLINLVLFLIFKLVSLAPGMWGAYYDSGSLAVNDALNSTIGGSSWIVLGSALAMIISSIINSLVNILVAKSLKNDNYWSFAARSFTSTAISQFADNMTFALVVSIPLFGWNLRQALVCSVVAASFELLIEVLFSGTGYKLSLRLKGNTPHSACQKQPRPSRRNP